jgi:hypothetical protein
MREMSGSDEMTSDRGEWNGPQMNWKKHRKKFRVASGAK